MADPGRTAEEYAADLATGERDAGRPPTEAGDVLGILEAMAVDGFIVHEGDDWFVA